MTIRGLGEPPCWPSPCLHPGCWAMLGNHLGLNATHRFSFFLQYILYTDQYIFFPHLNLFSHPLSPYFQQMTKPLCYREDGSHGTGSPPSTKPFFPSEAKRKSSSCLRPVPSSCTPLLNSSHLPQGLLITHYYFLFSICTFSLCTRLLAITT